MTIHKWVAAAVLMTVGATGWSQTPPDEHAGHHPPEAPEMAQSRMLIEKAEHAKSAAERKRLLAEHLTAMRQQLDALKGQECSMEKMTGGGMMMGDGMKDGHMMMCHEQMKARMAVMTELLEQTWRREEVQRMRDK